ncbi:MAG TPA: hypothetical protein VKU41_21605 [Polyangiaceae bacterium]|nr:hypothetical protein [Polyangiaceae bacterium]
MCRIFPAAIAAMFGVAVVARPALAWAVTCDALPNLEHSATAPPVVYVEGSGAARALLGPLQAALSVDAKPMYLVFVGDGGCLGAGNFIATQPMSRKVKPVYYTGQVQATCDLPATVGAANLAVSDAYAATCGLDLPTDVADLPGPIQPMLFVVPKASTQRSISAAGAYFVFGFGAASGVSPWDNSGSIYRLDASSATQALLAAAIRVPSRQWQGVDAGSLPASAMAGIAGADAVVNALATDAAPEHAIGILAGGDFGSTAADRIAVLAYKERGQSCGYFPDSTATAHDRANVRDGHYPLWGPLHFFARVDTSGVPLDANVARVLSYITGAAAPPGGVDPVGVDAASGLVPSCAMHVARVGEMGSLMSFAPQGSCGCYFDYVSTGQSSCVKCAKRADCPATAPVCNLSNPVGYCETQ